MRLFSQLDSLCMQPIRSACRLDKQLNENPCVILICKNYITCQKVRMFRRCDVTRTLRLVLAKKMCGSVTVSR